MPTELSPHSPRVAGVRELQTVRGRREARRFVAEGAILIDEALRSGLAGRELYVTPALVRSPPAERWEGLGLPVFVVAERALRRMSDLEAPTGLLAVFDLPEHRAETILAAAGVVLLLAGVNDPGNAGTLVRSADAFGAAGVLFGLGGADPFAPKVVRAAMGSLFRVPVASIGPNDVVAAAQAAGRPLIATGLEGDDIRAQPVAPNAILAVGNERRGVRDWLPGWDRVVRIPQRSTAESLNAAVAGSIILYEASRCQDPCQVAEKA